MDGAGNITPLLAERKHGDRSTGGSRPRDGKKEAGLND